MSTAETAARVATSEGRILSRRDIRFLLHDWLDVGALTKRPRHAGQSTDDYDEVLEVAVRIATERFAPHNRLSDAQEPYLDGSAVRVRPEIGEALRTLAEAGLVGASLDESVGGLQLPFVVTLAASAWMHAANTATYSYAMLTTAAAGMLAEHATASQAQRWIPPMLEGRFFGTMCLSEPDVGSSLADVTTRAERDDDGSYRIFGTKMWISGGDHDLAENILHMVLAKVPGGPAGVKGLSLFIVPRSLVSEDGTSEAPNDVTLAGLNHKMGYRGLVNTVLCFGEGSHQPLGRSGAVGYLVGEEHQGLAYMFAMMNEARIGVGTCATGLGYTGYLKSLSYARERLQGRPLVGRDPTAPPVAIIEHPDVRRMLLAQKAYVEGALALVLFCGRLVDDHQTEADPDLRDRARLLLEILTPIAKSWPSQWCLEANSLAIQIHGGYGYSRDYDVEQHYRDNRLNPIHEGTHGIQALDLLGRKVAMQNGAAFCALIAAMHGTIRRAVDRDEQMGALAEQLRSAVDRLDDVTTGLLASSDREAVLANATLYLEAFGHVVVAWLWLDLVLALGTDPSDDFAKGKQQAARFFYAYELPKVMPQLDCIGRLDRTVLDTEEDWL